MVIKIVKNFFITRAQNKKWSFVLIFFSIFFVSFALNVKFAEAFACLSNGTGNFNVSGNWSSCNSTTPQTTDTIEIRAGDTITLVATTQVAGMKINATGEIANGGFLLTDTGTGTGVGGFYLEGTLSGTGAVTLNGSGATIDGTGTPSFTGLLTLTNAKTIASTA